MEAIHVLLWYLLATAFGLLAWPLAFGMLPGLPDRGYTLSRALGLLLTGYVFWLLCSLGLLQNTTGGMLFSMLIVGGIGLWVYLSRQDRSETLRSWLAGHIRPVVIGEVLFLLAFAGWAVVRAYNPSLDYTEKPMELAFLNGVRGSRIFPPSDPWLSGYAISYYYFGYVIMAMLADLAGTTSGIAFNIGIALLFALTLLGSYGLVYNLVAKEGERKGLAVSALLGPIFIGVMGNLEGFLDLLRAMNLPFIGAGFWRWLDIEELTEPVTRVLWPPSQWRYWWWWRASRVIRDKDLTGFASGLQPIDEFPFFSFLLGDMHPHVLALPFVLLALALALDVLGQKQHLSWPKLVLLTLCFGGLAFLNVSDWPIYFFILISILIVRLIREEKPKSWQEWFRAGYGLVMPVGGMLAYLPWYISYRSQISGVLPNAIFATRLHQFIVMFGPFLFIIVWFLVDLAIRQRHKFAWQDGLLLGGGLLAVLTASMLGIGMLAAHTDPDARNFLLTSVGLTAPIDSSGNVLQDQIGQAMRAVIRYRIAHPLTPLVLTIIIIVALAYLLPLIRPPEKPEDEHDQTLFLPMETSKSFAMLLILTGAMLTLGAEFVYIRDVFGQRINTIFKFYYATWVLWGVASAYAVHVVLSQRQSIARYIFGCMVIVLMMAGLVYPSFAIPTKAGEFTSGAGQQPTLNGIEFIQRLYPADYQAILWLQQHAEPGSVILEAVGGSYTHYGRVSAATGLATVIGWPGHENQWRGSAFDELAAGREVTVREIYNTPNIAHALDLLDRYDVTYVFVGSLERNPAYASPAGIEKFERFLTPVYQNGDTAIYRVDDHLIKENP
ncbi:MAG: hypothetical protein JXB30_07590 [Anaerolineae bacterium]|nr:hypothetical protein [Anaerolineae bacterium]